MKILVTGSNGLLGQKIVYALRNRDDVTLIATARGENRIKEKTGYIFESLDLVDKMAIEELIIKYRPDAVIHTAAMTNVDACEMDPVACKVHNVDATQFLVDACKPFKTHFVHLSTDFVFDGENGPYKETDKPNPQSVYAHSKLDSEQLVIESGLPYSIIRTIIIYGVVDDTQRSNVVLWTKNSLEQGKQINVITDQLRGPTLAEDLAIACIRTVERKAYGIFHISGKEVMPIIDIAYFVADYYGLDKSLIQPITTADLNQPAKRPLKTGFILDKAEKILDYKPHSLAEGIAILEQQIKEKELQS
jgi:dTDP-4-dehydrorhamnose reductase